MAIKPSYLVYSLSAHVLFFMVGLFFLSTKNVKYKPQKLEIVLTNSAAPFIETNTQKTSDTTDKKELDIASSNIPSDHSDRGILFAPKPSYPPLAKKKKNRRRTFVSAYD